MSDAALRELERRWQETGSIADEVLFLRERVRLGRLPASQVWALGLAGSAACLTLLGLVRMTRRETWDALARWSSAFGHDQSGCRCKAQLCWAYLNGADRSGALVERWVTDVAGWTSAAGYLLVAGGIGFSFDHPIALAPPTTTSVDLFFMDRDFTSSLVVTHEPDDGPFGLRCVPEEE